MSPSLSGLASGTSMLSQLPGDSLLLNPKHLKGRVAFCQYVLGCLPGDRRRCPNSAPTGSKASSLACQVCYLLTASVTHWAAVLSGMRMILLARLRTCREISRYGYPPVTSPRKSSTAELNLSGSSSAAAWPVGRTTSFEPTIASCVCLPSSIPI